MSLAQETLTEDFKTLQEEAADPNCAEYRHSKDQVLTRLRKLQPGAATALKAVRGPDGTVTLDPAGMARELATYWQGVFTARPVDLTELPE